jgi:hypothetical protein
MTDEQINQHIAEACGWNDFVVHPEFGLMGVEPNTHGLRTAVPWYVYDLNAMHQAEKVLNKKQVREYQTYMYDMACEIDNTCGRWMPYSATARYRAGAFLKTLGKWEEAQK